jgi:hypothetical protein
MFLRQFYQGQKALLRIAEHDDFKPGDVYYDVVVRAGIGLVSSEATGRPNPQSAVCLEYDALQCVQDPIDLFATVSGNIKQRSILTSVDDVTIRASCSYDDGVRVARNLTNVTLSVGTLSNGTKNAFQWIFPIPPVALQYVNGDPYPRAPLSFECTLNATSPIGDENMLYQWTGTVNCSELALAVARSVAFKLNCSGSSLDDDSISCRIQEGTVTDSAPWLALIVTDSCMLAILLTLVALIIYRAHELSKSGQQTTREVGQPALEQAAAPPDTRPPE